MNNTSKETKKFDDEGKMGALFSNTSKAGNTYFTGFINGQRVVAYVTKGTNKETGADMTVLNVFEHKDSSAETDKKSKTKNKKAASTADLDF